EQRVVVQHGGDQPPDARLLRRDAVGHRHFGLGAHRREPRLAVAGRLALVDRHLPLHLGADGRLNPRGAIALAPARAGRRAGAVARSRAIARAHRVAAARAGARARSVARSVGVHGRTGASAHAVAVARARTVARRRALALATPGA